MLPVVGKVSQVFSIVFFPVNLKKKHIKKQFSYSKFKGIDGWFMAKQVSESSQVIYTF